MKCEVDLIGDYLDKLLHKLDSELDKCKAHPSEKSVHDTRVCLRRIMAAVEILDTVSQTDETISQKHLKRLKEIHKLFSPIRDTQISMLYAHEMINEFPSIGIFEEYLESREKRLSFKLQKKLSDTDTYPLHKVLKAVKLEVAERFGENGLLGDLRSTTDRAFSKVVELIGQVDTDDIKSVHKVRIAFKRFRYMVELLDVLQPIEEYLLNGMKAIQDELGAIQDITVVEELLQRFIEKKSPGGRLLSLEYHELLSRRKKLAESFAASAVDIKNMWSVLK